MATPDSDSQRTLTDELWDKAYEDKDVTNAFDHAEELDDRNDPAYEEALKDARELHDDAYDRLCDAHQSELEQEVERIRDAAEEPDASDSDDPK